MTQLLQEVRRQHEEGHHHDEHGHCHDGHEHCHDGHGHHHDGHEHCHDGHGHHHDGHEHCHDHHHDHHGPDCTCGCHDHEHHHADEIFTSWGRETSASYTKAEIEERLCALEEEKTYGYILRAKGMLADGNGGWTYFDYVPGEVDVRAGKAELTGKICVIGSGLQEERLAALFDK